MSRPQSGRRPFEDRTSGSASPLQGSGQYGESLVMLAPPHPLFAAPPPSHEVRPSLSSAQCVHRNRRVAGYKRYPCVLVSLALSCAVSSRIHPARPTPPSLTSAQDSISGARRTLTDAFARAFAVRLRSYISLHAIFHTKASRSRHRSSPRPASGFQPPLTVTISHGLLAVHGHYQGAGRVNVLMHDRARGLDFEGRDPRGRKSAARPCAQLQPRIKTSVVRRDSWLHDCSMSFEVACVGVRACGRPAHYPCAPYPPVPVRDGSAGPEGDDACAFVYSIFMASFTVSLQDAFTIPLRRVFTIVLAYSRQFVHYVY